MHDPKIEQAAAEYLERVDTRPGQPWRRGEVQRHLVAFAEEVLHDQVRAEIQRIVRHEPAHGGGGLTSEQQAFAQYIEEMACAWSKRTGLGPEESVIVHRKTERGVEFSIERKDGKTVE